MAKLSDLDELMAGTGDPLSGGAIIYDASGKQIGTTPYSPSVNEAIGNKQSLYKTPEGDWSRDTQTSITLDEETGKVNVRAPKSVLEATGFKEKVLDSGLLSQLASQYKANHDFKLPDPLDKEKTISAQEYITNYLEKPLKDYAEVVRNREDVRAEVAKVSANPNLANKLSEKDFILMSNTATGDNAKDTDLISIPKTLNTNFFQNVKNATGFDSENFVISKKDLRAGPYNLSNTSDEDLSTIVTDVATRMAEIGRKTDPTDEDAEEYARLRAFLSYARSEKPEADFWQQLRLFGKGTLQGIESAAHRVGGSLLVLGEGIANALNFALTPSFIKGEGLAPTRSTALLQDFQASLQNDATIAYQLEAINTDAATLRDIVELGATVGLTLYTGHVASKAVTTGVQATTQYFSLTRALETMARGAATPAAAAGIRKSSASLTATLAGGVSKSNIVNTASAIYNIAKMDPAVFANSVNTFTRTLYALNRTPEVAKILNDAVRVINTTRTIGTASNVVAQVLVDTLVTDPVVARKVFEESDSESMGSLLLTLATDATLFGAGFGLQAIASKFPHSKAGRSASARAARAEARASTGVVAAKEKIKSMVLRDADYVSHIKSASKREVAQSHALIQKATQAVAKSGEGLSGWDKTLDIEKNLNNLRAVQNAIDFSQIGVRAFTNKIVDPNISPEIFGAWSKATSTTKRIQLLERKYGLDPTKDFNKDTKVPSPLTRTTDNYIGAVYAREYIEGYMDKFGQKPQGVDADLERIQAIIDDYEAKYPEIASQVPAYLDDLVAQEAALQDWKVKHQLMTEEQFKINKERTLAKRGFIHTERIKPVVANERVQTIILERKNPTTFIDEHYRFGSQYDYANMYNAFLNEVSETAVVANAKAEFKGMTAPNNIKRNILVGGGDYERAQTFDKLKGNFKKEVKTSILSKQGIAHDYLRRSKLMSDFGDYIVARQAQLSQDAKAQSAARKITRAQAKTPRITNVDKMIYLQELSPEELSDIAATNIGSTFTNITPEDYNDWVNPAKGTGDEKLATALRKEVRHSIAINSDFITGNYGTEAGDILSSLPKIKTSSYKKLMGIKTLKDADPLIRPYLTESGVDLESGDWGQWMQEYVGNFEDGGSFAGTPDDVLDWYTGLIERRNAEREGLLPTYENFQKAIEFDPELPNRLNMTLVKGTGYLDSPELKAKLAETKQQKIIEELNSAWQGDLDELAKLMGAESTALYNVQAQMNDMLTELMYSGVRSNSAAREALESLSTIPAIKDTEMDYVILSELYNNRKDFGEMVGDSLRDEVRRGLSQYKVALSEPETFNVDRAVDKFVQVFDDVLYQRRNNALQVLKDAGSPLADSKDVYEEIRGLMKDIEGAEARLDVDVVRWVNDDGQIELAETDPLVAKLINYRAARKPSNFLEQMLASKPFQLSNRLFRLNTTGVNAKSVLNQWAKDSLSAYVGGGTVLPMKITERQIAANFGERIAEDYRLNMPKIYEQFEAQAKAQNKTVAEVATRYEMASGTSYVREATETATRRIDAPARGIDAFKNKVEKIISGAEQVTNGFREEMYRNGVYAYNMQKGLERGYDLATSRNFALRAMFDATTDFNRMTLHLQAFTNSVPYLRAGINGTKSFWRLMSLDPVGVMTRLTTGVILPVVAATVSILRDDENRDYYKTLYEREKDGNFMFVMNGKFYSIPLPEEIGSMVAPFRQWVEKMYDANRHAFWELAINDLVGIIPYDLTGFQDIDSIALGSDPTLLQRLGSMGMGLLADVLPPVGKTAFELAYGVDPYTGKKINKSYMYVDDDYNLQLMDSTQSEFAQWLGKLTGGAPSVISTVLSNFIGQTGRNVLDSMVSLAQWVSTGGQEGKPLALLEKTLGDMGDVLTVAEYDRTANIWDNAVRELYNVKDGMMANYNKYSAAIQSARTDDERRKAIAKRNDYIAPYVKRVQDTVDDFRKKYGGAIDNYRFSSVVSLLNFYTPPSDLTTDEDILRAQEQQYRALETARLSVQNMGIDSPTDQSLLGYMYTDKEGKNRVKFYTPLEILNAQSVLYGAAETHRSSIETILKEADIDRKAMFSDYNAATTKAEKKAAKQEWNTRVVMALAPYIQKYGAEAVISNQETVDLLSRYIFVDNPWEAREYLQKIFSTE